jgi:hypothetical protein
MYIVHDTKIYDLRRWTPIRKKIFFPILLDGLAPIYAIFLLQMQKKSRIGALYCAYWPHRASLFATVTAIFQRRNKWEVNRGIVRQNRGTKVSSFIKETMASSPLLLCITNTAQDFLSEPCDFFPSMQKVVFFFYFYFVCCTIPE